MTNAHDQLHVDQPSVCDRTVFVETSGVHTTDFHLTERAKRGLFDNGVRSATSFLDQWNFAEWRRRYPSRAA